MNDITFSGDVRSLAGSVRGDGSFTAAGVRYPFRVSSGPSADGSATRLHLNIDPGERPILADLEGVLAFDNRQPKFDGALTLAVPATKKAGEAGPTPWKLATRLKADPAGAKFEQIDASFGTEDTALKLGGVGDLRFGASPLLRAVLSARQVDADRLTARDDADPQRVLPALRAALRRSRRRQSRRRSNSMPTRSCSAAVHFRTLRPNFRPTAGHGLSSGSNCVRPA